jgi:saccharopine dehydrogenase (NAD+, L-lysine-forming)
MEACLAAGVSYLDTANYEPPDVAKFEYKWQWDFQDRFREKGLMAVLGCGFDPGATNLFCAHAQKHEFDVIQEIDILDANGGDHGHPFATNFNPEINIREITQEGRFWEKQEWKSTAPMEIHRPFDFPEIGPREMYLMYHEEMESLVLNIPGLERIRFWMTFSPEYLNHLRVLEAVGMTSIEPVHYEGQEIVPLKFLKAVLPDPASLGPKTRGNTCIGCLISGSKDGQDKTLYIYNVCSHEKAYAEVGSQAVSYTTGVPAMIGARLMLEGIWKESGVYNVEQLDPDPFMEQMNTQGLPWQVKQLDSKPSL